MESFNLSHLIRTAGNSGQVVIRTFIITFQSLVAPWISTNIKSFKLSMALEEGIKQYFLGSDINLEYLGLILRTYFFTAGLLISKTVNYRHIVHSFISRVWSVPQRSVKSCLN